MSSIPHRPKIGTELIAIAVNAPSDCTTLRSSLETRGYIVFQKRGLKDVADMVRNATATAVLISETVSFEHSSAICRTVRRISQVIPIIILHRGLDLEQRLELFAAGADHCAQLPVPVDTILTTIQVVSRHFCRISDVLRLPGATGA
ncbi:hypothetical protein [Roseibium sp. Sym1]|uniref:hypothetical protein n=1 Tax=Roseibium sp. Sym1 TaxID=3016006 RepID=UPI0022B35B33|nr:hypothetical protein [Roseibium sp. Sym1]